MSLGRISTVALFSSSILVLSIGLYFIFERFLGVTGDEIVKAWYYGEMVELQEGQVLPAIAKNQGVLENSPFIKSVKLIDVNDPYRSLFAIGEKSYFIDIKNLELSTKSSEKLTRFRSGFLANTILARIPGNNNLIIIYEISSHLLIWSYFLAVALGILFVVYLMGITIRISNFERQKRESLRTDLLARLAHDIDSPLLTISNLSLKIKKIDKELHHQLEKASESIRGLLFQTSKADKKLLNEEIASNSAIDMDLTDTPLVPVLTEFMVTKRREYSDLCVLNLSFKAAEDLQDVFVKINLDDFKRHLSNIFKNSIEATSGQVDQKIILQVSRQNDEVIISIADSGHGIPNDQLHLIGKKGISIGKKDGKGLGLYFVKESVNHWRGNLKIESKEYVGTTISISLPITPTPKWYISKMIVPNAHHKCVFVDDDKSMIERWKARLSLSKEDFIEFNTANTFRQWFHSGGQMEDNLRFIFDFHLDGENTGLAIIDELGIAKESTLVTSGYLNETIIAEAKRLNVQIMPKIFV